MRIEANFRTSGVASRSGVGQAQGGGEFRLGEAAASARAGSAPLVSGPASIGALLALQAVGDATEGRRRQAIKRGRTLLDTLEEMRADFLAGRANPAMLDRLATILSEERETAEPQLDALLDDIELRVRVELAKHGR
ncbi:hypothetical protein VE25_17605 [Devosia geojensis]|uniref:Flagellar assembly regulator FliX n=1 Tax=Devosia geojensis TaxID=443610 RepID=A0A0F5FPR6_9HYPH|nr:flagellar assembly protein FliX [Devosia geojensis]KKB10550.1 hypothetical protein VE25_17605 [Devosia geojensis]